MIPAVAPHGAARTVNWRRVLAIGTLAILGISLLVGLGIWQLERRLWKLDLMRKVEARFAVPPRNIMATDLVDPAAHEYEHVNLAGTYLHDRDTWIHASTERGAGYWVMSPLLTTQGSIVLINRGFVPMDTPRRDVARPGGHAVVGVLRLSEPDGIWPRRNQPDQDRWYSRDVAAIARRRGLTVIAPYFIDVSADPSGTESTGARAPAGPVQPVVGLTVVHFRNAHLSYALTWFCLALMTLAAGIYAIRGEFIGRDHPG